MKVILYMAVSANGRITGKDEEVDWVSKNSWGSYLATLKGVGNMIIGHNTYKVMGEDELQDEYLYVVMTKHLKTSDKRNVLFSDQDPKNVLELLESKGYKKALVAGGSQINSLFMKQGLVDEVYLDIEPILLGKGISLFDEADFEYELKLLDTKKLSKNTIQLHYQVIK